MFPCCHLHRPSDNRCWQRTQEVSPKCSARAGRAILVYIRGLTCSSDLAVLVQPIKDGAVLVPATEKQWKAPQRRRCASPDKPCMPAHRPAEHAGIAGSAGRVGSALHVKLPKLPSKPRLRSRGERWRQTLSKGAHALTTHWGLEESSRRAALRAARSKAKLHSPAAVRPTFLAASQGAAIPERAGSRQYSPGCLV